MCATAAYFALLKIENYSGITTSLMMFSIKSAFLRFCLHVNSTPQVILKSIMDSSDFYVASEVAAYLHRISSFHFFFCVRTMI